MSVSVKAWGSKFHYAPTGGVYQQQYVVDGLPTTNADNTIVAITAQDVATGLRIPPYQSPHPTQQGLFCSGFDTQHLGTEQSPNRAAVLVTVTFSTPEFLPNSTLIEIGSLNGSGIMNRWVSGPLSGKPILVGVSVDSDDGKIIRGPSYNYPPQIDSTGLDLRAGIPLSGSNGTFTFSRYYDTVQIPVMSGGIVLTFTRRENNPPLIGRYHRRVNATAWQGLAAGLWVCRSITAKNLIGVGSIFPGGGYECRYEFQSAPDLDLPSGLGGFIRCELYKDPHTGKPIAGVDPTDGSFNGYALVQPYAPVEFNELNFPVVCDLSKIGASQ